MRVTGREIFKREMLPEVRAMCNFRVDRQLAGRCSRQGQPGTFIPILSLQDAQVWAAADAGQQLTGS